MRRAIVAATVAASMLVGAPAFGAISPTVNEFSTGLNAGSDPYGATAGPDGNVWFTDKGTTPAVGYVTPAGSIVEFSAGLNSGAQPREIVTGSDGNLWFTDTGSTAAIGRITPSGVITEFSAGLNAGAVPSDIAAGPDGDLWFADSGSTGAIGQVTTAGAITESSAGLPAGSSPGAIVAGNDGNVWFIDNGTTTALGIVAPGGAITEFTSGLNSGASPSDMTLGPDGNVWFTDSGTTPAIGRITPGGAITEFSAGLTSASPAGITSGSDGNLWFADSNGAIGRATPQGEISEYGQSDVGAPQEVASGSDGNIWFTDPQGQPAAIGQITLPPLTSTGSAAALGAGAVNVAGALNPLAQLGSYKFEYGTTVAYGSKTTDEGFNSSVGNLAAAATISGLTPSTTYHYRIATTNSTGTVFGSDATFTTPALPRLSGVTASPRAWRLGRRGATLSRRTPVGTKIGFTLDRAVLVELKFDRELSGRRKGGKCEAPKRANRRGKLCTRLRTAGHLYFNAKAGRNVVRFEGKVSRSTKLAPGDYRVYVMAKDLTVSQAVTAKARFTVKRR